MRAPTEFELKQLAHLYDPAKAHEYYEKHKKLTGRKKVTQLNQEREKASAKPSTKPIPGVKAPQKNTPAKAKQRKELQARIQNLEKKLQLLKTLIRKREREEHADDRKSKAKKERAAKERDKPKSAAEKAKAARDNEKYRDKHKQELKNKAKDSSSKSGGSTASKSKNSKGPSTSDLKALSAKVEGQIAVAKVKLAAL